MIIGGVDTRYAKEAITYYPNYFEEFWGVILDKIYIGNVDSGFCSASSPCGAGWLYFKNFCIYL